jgi:catechol 2,3-dioxygenase-like lactoylglutathione lyase family enzyme
LKVAVYPFCRDIVTLAEILPPDDHTCRGAATMPSHQNSRHISAPALPQRRHSETDPRAQDISMIDHLGFPVSDYDRAKSFYTKALAPLGYSVVMEVTQEQNGGFPAAGFGADGKPDFWIGGEGGLNKPLHIALLAKDRAAVDAFYSEAMAAGARDNGAPGIRAHYHPNYYAAFVLDSDGHNIEAVSHAPE